MIGHSLGAKKEVYYAYRQQNPLLSGLILLSTSKAYKKKDLVTEKFATDLLEKGKDLIPWPPFGPEEWEAVREKVPSYE